MNAEGPRGPDGDAIALVTKHGKERAIAPPFRRLLGRSVVALSAIDTDRFGTFSGETPRRLNARDTVLAKAHLARACGYRRGIASEGSYGPHPLLPFAPAGEELMCYVDFAAKLEIVERLFVERTNFGSHACADPETARAFLQRIGFPEHGVVVVPSAPTEPGLVFRGIHSAAALAGAVAASARNSRDGRALVSADMRAHANPTRMAALRRLAVKLALRLRSRCGACAAPGWGLVEVEYGLPCGVCGAATSLVAREIYGCAVCSARAKRPRRDGRAAAGPEDCERCNP